MHLPHFARRPLAVLAALSLVLAACSDSSAPDAPFDPAGTSADIESTLNTFDTPVLNSYGTISDDVSGVIGGSVTAAVAVSPRSLATRTGAIRFAKQFVAKLQARTGAATGTGPNFATSSIPPEYAGKTFEYNTGTGQYEPTDRTGAPSNGVRFILYELDAETGLPVTPLNENEIGYVQLTANESGTSASAHLTVVATPSNITYFDYTLSVSYTSTSATLNVSGFVSNGTDRVNFNFYARYTSDQKLILNYAFSVPTSGFRLETSVTLDVEALTGSLAITARGPHGRIAITGVVATESESYDVRVNGDLFAHITVEGSTVTVVGADGQPLDADELNAVEQLFTLLSGGLGFFDGLINLFGAL